MIINDYVYTGFSYSMPASVEFGYGVINKLGEIVSTNSKKKVLVVTDKGIVQAGLVEKVTDVLKDHNISYTVFDGVKAEPDASGIVEAVEIVERESCDVVVSVGGGSSMDTGKGVAIMATNPGHIRDYAGLNLIKNPGMMHIAIPTTSGTGSEATIWAVISEKDKGIKYGVGSNYMVPTISMCDPAMTMTLPPRLTALSGIDALSHALESYINKATQPVSEALSEGALRLIAKSLRTAVHAGDVVEARADMMLASTMAAMAFNPTRLGNVHALAMPVGAKVKISHAEAIAVLTPSVLEFNCVANYEKYARLADIFGEDTLGLTLRESAELGIEGVLKLLADVGAPTSLSEFGIKEEDIEELAKGGMTSGNIKVNPRITRQKDLEDILRSCL
jgi:alcohol dehydrogenase